MASRNGINEMTQPNPKDPQAELREKLRMELLPKFTDDYIDEWTSKGNDISGLHEINDAFADEILALFQARQQQLLSELLGEAVEVNTDDDVNVPVVPVSVINRKIGELNG